MITIYDGKSPINRRELLRIGSLGFGGLSLASLLGVKAQANDVSRALSGKSVIFLFQQGGPSQFETFDPKMDQPDEIRTIGSAIQTALPGVTFGHTMEQLAKLADKFTVVRSFKTNNGGHNIQPIVGPDSLDTNIGVHYSVVAGATRPHSGVPTNAVLFPAAVDPKLPGPEARGNLSSTGNYGSAYAPFVPGGNGQLQKDMKLSLPRERFFNDRRGLLNELDRMRREIDREQFGSIDELRRQAYEVLLSGGVANAMDLKKEDPSTMDLYDTGEYTGGSRWNKVNRGKRGYYNAQASSIGKLLLMARRLCESGCGFVTIHAGYAGVWDMHADGNNLNMHDGMQAVGRSFDHAVAAFIQDLEDRGLSEKIMLVCCGEMGRTPRINKRGGRDHWANLAPLLLYGGGIKKGQVIGQSTRNGSDPASDPLTPKHLISTILNTVYHNAELRLLSGVPAPVTQLVNEPQIPGLT